jgi:RNA polymerase sigma factor (sigma-70 family)
MSEFPAILTDLLVDDPPSAAWAAFTHEYSRLLLHVARATCHGHDEAMDAYAYLLEKLSEDRCKRLRSYSADPRSKFTTWLVVVCRRICVDYQRGRYGRLRDDDSEKERARLGLRKNLARLGGDNDLIEVIPDESAITVTSELEKAELAAALANLRLDLRPGDRLLLSLRFDDGASASEIASVLGYPSQFHVYRRLNVLLSEMKAKLAAIGHESAAI